MEASCSPDRRPGSTDQCAGGPRGEAMDDSKLRAHLHPEEDVRPFLSRA